MCNSGSFRSYYLMVNPESLAGCKEYAIYFSYLKSNAQLINYHMKSPYLFTSLYSSIKLKMTKEKEK